MSNINIAIPVYNHLPSKLSPEEEYDVINELLKNTQLNKSPSTQKTYKYSLWNFLKYLNENEPDFPLGDSGDLIDIYDKPELDKEAIFQKWLFYYAHLPKLKGWLYASKYITWLKINNQSSSTIYTKITALKVYVKFVRTFDVKEEITWNLDELTTPKVEHEKIDGVSEEEFEKLLEYFLNLESSERYEDRRDALLFFVLGFTGLRISGALSILIEEINWKKNSIKVFLKGHTERKSEYFIGNELLNRIKSFLLFDDRENGPIFVAKRLKKKNTLRRESAFRIIRDRGIELGIENLHPHRFRHFAATEALELTKGNIHQAMKFTTHNSEKIFRAYEDARKNEQLLIAGEFEKKWLKK